MMGTLARLLANHQILTSQDRYRAEVEGNIENVGGVLKITSIRVHYFLKVPQEKKEAIQQSLEAYLPFCPAAQSIIGCIHISHQLTLQEE
jgi:organic hydroperoxide reductase OsmC/OhrA